MKSSFTTEYPKFLNTWKLLARMPWLDYMDAAAQNGLFGNPFCTAATDQSGKRNCNKCPAVGECPDILTMQWQELRNIYDIRLQEGRTSAEVMVMTDTLSKLAKRVCQIKIQP